VCCPLQFLCNEVAALQQAGRLRQLQVFDVAHMAWRLKVASQLQKAIHSYEQVGPLSVCLPVWLSGLLAGLLACWFVRLFGGMHASVVMHFKHSYINVSVVK
jgi:hypothetical protein